MHELNFLFFLRGICLHAGLFYVACYLSIWSTLAASHKRDMGPDALHARHVARGIHVPSSNGTEFSRREVGARNTPLRSIQFGHPRWANVSLSYPIGNAPRLRLRRRNSSPLRSRHPLPRRHLPSPARRPFRSLLSRRIRHRHQRPKAHFRNVGRRHPRGGHRRTAPSSQDSRGQRRGRRRLSRLHRLQALVGWPLRRRSRPRHPHLGRQHRRATLRERIFDRPGSRDGVAHVDWVDRNRRPSQGNDSGIGGGVHALEVRGFGLEESGVSIARASE